VAVGRKNARSLVVNVPSGIDGSDDATVALRTAVRLLSPTVCNVDLLCFAPGTPQSWGSARMDYNDDQRILGETTQILERARGNLNFDAQLISLCAEILGPKACGASRYMAFKQAEEPSTATSIRAPSSLRKALPTRTDPSAYSATGPSPTVEALRSLFDLSSTEICLISSRRNPLDPVGAWRGLGDLLERGQGKKRGWSAGAETR